MRISKFMQKHRRFIIFVLVGCINTAVDFLTFVLVHRLTGLPEKYCQAISYAAGGMCSFILNRTVTFKDGEKMKLPTQFIRFWAVNLTSLLVSMLGIEALMKAGFHVYVSKLLITAAVAVINYLICKLAVFRVKD